MGKTKLNKKEALELKKLELEVKNLKWYRIPGYYTAGVTFLAVLFSVGVSLYSGYFDKVRLSYEKDKLENQKQMYSDSIFNLKQIKDSLRNKINEISREKDKLVKLKNSELFNLKEKIDILNLTIKKKEEDLKYIVTADLTSFRKYCMDSMTVYKNIVAHDKFTILILQEMLGEGGLHWYNGPGDGIYNKELSEVVERFRGNKYKKTKDYDPVYMAIEKYLISGAKYKLLHGPK